MRTVILVTLLTLGCAQSHKPCFTTLELSVHGSQSDGSSTGQPFDPAGNRDRWDNDDVTIGGSASLTFDFTGACEWER